MENSGFKKIICALGHSSEVVPWEMPLPKKCPVCGQPYDRRYNIPVMCLEDGTVPAGEEQAGWAAQGSRTGEAEAEQERRDQDIAGKGSEISVSRRRILPGADLSAGEPVIRAKRREDAGGRTEIAGNITQKSIVLYSDGKKINVPLRKEYLGRDEAGADIFFLNPLISRRHAQIYADRFGNVYLKDEDSLNGTFADDGGGRRRLLKGETAVLKSGDKLWLADQLLAIEEE